MEELPKKIEKTPDELLLKNVRNELLREKAKNLEQKKENGYNLDFADLDINLIGIEEARLFQKIADVKNEAELDAAEKDFFKYRSKISEEFKNDIESGNYKGSLLDYPKGAIVSILGNKLTSFVGKFDGD